MTAVELLSQLRDLGVGVQLSGDRIRVRAPKGVLTEEMQARLAAHRDEILAFLREAEAAGGSGARRTLAIPVRPKDRPAPLSFAQQRLWFLDQLDPGGVEYNLSIAWRLAGALDTDALRRALDEIVARHEVLRTTIDSRDGVPVQTVHPPAPVELPFTDLTHLPAEQARDEAARIGEADAWQPFDLATGPLLRVRLIRIADAEHVLPLTLHHILFDEWSENLLYEELSALYGAFRASHPSPLPPLPVQYADYATWQRGWLDGGALDGQLDYWRAQLSGLATLDLPTDHRRPPVPGLAGAALPLAVPADVAAGLAALSRRAGTTMFMTLLAAFQALLSRYAGGHDIAVGTPVAGRTHPDTERLIGFFVNTLVLRTDTSGDPSFAELLARVRRTALDAYANQEVPFEKLVEELAPRRDRARHPLFQVMFNFMSIPAEGGAGPSLPELDISESDAPLSVARFDLTLSMAERGGTLEGTVGYRTDLFDESTVSRLTGNFQALLAAVAAAPELRLSELHTVPEAELAQLARWASGPAGPPVPAVAVHELIAEQTRRTPDAPAIVAGAERTSYAELAARAGRLAGELRRRGVGAESVVAVLLDRGVELIVALLAVWKAGAAYLPIDPDTPAARLAFQITDSRPHLVLSSSRQTPAHGALGDVPVLAVDEVRPGAAPAGVGGRVHPDNAAYLIYTSGSTGRPKAVVVSHRSVANYLLWARATYAIAGHGGAALATSVAYDLTVTALFLPLVSGEAVGIADAGRPGLLKLTPSHLHALPRPAKQAMPHVLVLGGEQLTRHALRAWFDAGPPCRVVNEYGPTEATVGCCAHELTPGDDGPTVPIGRPVANATCHVLDARLRPVPVGVPGELFVGGAGLARGYAGRPAVTAQRFVADPLAGDGSRLYRTGDLVRRRSDGVLEFLGRTDDQISLRGHRVEPAEIEAAIAEHPLVAAASVVAIQVGPGDQRLTAYIVPAGEAPTAGELRAHLGTRLPDHLIPATYLTIDALPLTAGGKVDRAALPAPDTARPELAARYEPPRTATERVVAGIWSEVLRLDRIGAADDFFELGGHSLLAAQVTARIRARLGADLPLSVVFDRPVLADLAAEVDQVHTPPPPPIARVRAGGPLPLSFAQQRLWFLHQFDPTGTEYHIAAAARLLGPLDVDALRRALGEIVARHEVLRTAFGTAADGTPTQLVRPPAPVELPVDDLTELPPEQARAEAARLLDADAESPFDLSSGTVLRARLVRTPADGDVLGLTVHHIAFDEWSLEVFDRELRELYAAFRDGRPSPLPALPVQYADFAAWQREWLSGERLREHLDYWRAQLADLPTVTLPTARRRPVVRDHVGIAVPFEVPPRITQGLRQLGRRAKTSMFMTVLAALQVLLARYSGEPDVVVGTPIANRGHPETEPLIGPFLNVLALRADLSTAQSFADALATVRAVVLDAYRHQDLPFEQLVGELQPDRDRGRHPLFQVVLNYQADDTRERPATEPAVTGCDLPTTPAPEKFDLRMAVSEVDGGLRGELVYRVDLFDRGTVERMVCHFEALLDAVAADPDRDLGTIDLLSPDEYTQLARWSGALRATGTAARRVPDRIGEWALATPDAVAVVAGDAGALSYAELDVRANRLAHQLRRYGIGPETVVALCLPVTPELVVAVLAVFRSGAAYLALDPTDPLPRLAHQLTDAAASLLVTSSGVLDVLPDQAIPLVIVDDPGERAAIDAMPATPPAVVTHPAQAAYLIYTSGSTGAPKAVTVTHEGLDAYTEHVAEPLGLRPGDRCAVSQPPAVDFANTMLYGCLTRGGTLHLLDAHLTDLGNGHRLEHLKLVPSHLAALLAATDDPARLLPARTLVLGGEATPHDLATRLHDLTKASGVALLNHYGPTETTVGATTHLVQGPPVTATLPIGRPLPHATCHVLDRRMRAVPVGVPGELHIGGLGLARGYHGRPALTAERFIAADGGARLYRTGDLARWLPDGTLEFLGRTDHQVKIRGHRIEPAEVEAVLTAHPAVAEAVVTTCDGVLVAHLVAAGADRPAIGELRRHLAERLPEPAVPSAFVLLDALPRTAAGKVDRRALPPPETTRPELADAYCAPRTRTELMLAEVWREVLCVDRVGCADDFFDLGGHSLLATQLIARLRTGHGVELPLATLFDNPTLGALAAAIDAGQPVVTGPPLVPMNQLGGDLLFFCVAPLSGSPFCYRALAQGLGPGCSFVGLQAPGVDDDQPPLGRIEDLTAHYLAAIRTLQPAGPYFLGGWSMGSLVALELANRLAAAGEEVGLLCLIGPAALRPRFVGVEIRRTRALIAGLEGPTSAAADRLGLKKRIQPLACEPDFAGDPARADPALLRRRLHLIATNLDAARRYRPRPYPGPITILLPRQQRWTGALLRGWRRVAGRGLDVHTMPGSHNSMVMDESNARVVASWLTSRLRDGPLSD